MKRVALSMLGFALVMGTSFDGAAAQDQIVTEAPSASSTPAAEAPVVDAPPGEAPPLQKSYEEYKRDTLEKSALRSRNALIGTAAATVVGTALVFPALANQCFRFDFAATNNIRCTTAGKAMLGIGWPLFFGGMTGVMVTGIMFGVRKGKLRRLDDRMAYEKSRAVRWDPVGSRFVF
jgi:hypothetical protein